MWRDLLRWRPWLFGAWLAASMAANIALFETSEGYLKQANAVRLDPAGLKVYEKAPMPVHRRPVLVLFGDSRALMWPEPDASIPYEVVNRGIGNQTTAQLLLRFDTDVTKLRPAVIVLEAGVNDLKTIAQFPERTEEIIAECELNFRRILARCSEAGATTVLVSVFDIGNVALWRRPFWSERVAVAVGEVNRWLATLAADRVVFFDANAALRDARGKLRDEYQFDYLHLAPLGYRALNERLAPLLNALPH